MGEPIEEYVSIRARWRRTVALMLTEGTSSHSFGLMATIAKLERSYS